METRYKMYLIIMKYIYDILDHQAYIKRSKYKLIKLDLF